MSDKKHLLIVDDDLDMGMLLDRFFKDHGFQTHRTTSGQAGLDAARKQPMDVALCDFRLPDVEGLDLLKGIKEIRPQTEVIIITGYSDVRVAVRAMKFGAFDYVTKPLVPDDILDKVKQAIKKQDSRTEPAQVTPKSAPATSPKTIVSNGNRPGFLEGTDPKSRKLHQHIELVGRTEMSVLIMGETGAGKEQVARLVHQHSPRSSGPFLAVDCGALPENLAASELFGHRKGAFTGAVADKAGYFEAAKGGTLFLDEIGNLSYPVQVQLLRVLQERKVRRVGETKSRDVDVRLVAATNEDLRNAIKDGDFREDLYHRLNEFELIVPPIRERGEDLMRFAHFFLGAANEELTTAVEGFSPKAVEIFERYEWPGNLREMRNVVRRATLLAREQKIEPAHLPGELSLYSRSSSVNAEGELKSAALEAEKEVILQALKAANYNKSQTARDLNIDRKTLYNKLKAFGIG